jgi:hypothetical protein
MFVRYRETPRRLQVSLVETRRIDGKVRHEHVAALGSIEVPLSIAGRIEFWRRLHERLVTLANRIPAQAKILGDIHARIPMVTAEEQRALQLENAEAEARFWAGINQMHDEQAEGYAHHIKLTETAITNSKAAGDAAAAHAAGAQERVERLKRGEVVEGGLKPFDPERLLRQMGFTTSDLQHATTMAALPESAIETIVKAEVSAGERAGRAAARRLLREQR